MMIDSKYLIVVHLVTAGLQDDDLGSDEEEVVLFSWLVIDTTVLEILEKRFEYVRPKNKDINDNILSEVARDSYGITEEKIKYASTLENVIHQMDTYINTHLVKKSTNNTSSSSPSPPLLSSIDENHQNHDKNFNNLNDNNFNNQIHLITDGQLHLRQVLHPEAVKKSIMLPEYFYRFFDLRKEFRKFYRNNDMKTLDDMLNYLSIKSGDTPTQNNNGTNGGTTSKLDLVQCKLSNMASIINQLIIDGHKFEEIQVINDKLEPGICSKNEFVDNNTVVRARGLPWQSSDQDIANFFKGLNIVKGGVALCLSVQGRRNGEALVRFVNQEHRDMALRRHKHHIGPRYIEVYRATGEDFLNVAGGNNNEAQAFLSKGGQAIIRMRGLPYDCTAQQVIEFFANNGEKCEVMHGEEGVLFVRKPDGRPTGDAFVQFKTEDLASKSLQKHRESIGSRYIELFRSTTAEVQQVFNRSMEARMYGELNALNSQQQTQQQQSILPALVTQSLLQQQQHSAAAAGSHHHHHHHHHHHRKDCIKLRGLPYEAQVEQILEFLGEHSKNIVFQGVHMVYNAQGQPSGEAFIQMDSEQSAALAAQHRHHRYMIFGKKQRYIEVFQCSVEDMNLTSGFNLQRPLMSSAAPLLPPPFGAFSFGHISPNHPAVTAAAAAAAAATSVQHPILPLNSNPSVQHTAAAAATARLPPPTASAYGTFNPSPFNLIYWPYPSPPVSPTAYAAFATTHHHTPAPAMVNMRGLR